MTSLRSTPRFRASSYLLGSALVFTLLSCDRDLTEEEALEMALEEFGQIDESMLPDPGSEAEIELGRKLFWDPILSGNRDVACASCHHPDNAYAESLSLSRGVGATGLSDNRTGGTLVRRNSMTILNVAFNGVVDVDEPVDPEDAPMFWDNRESSMEKQALGPIHSLEEMRGDVYSEDETVKVVATRLSEIDEYVQLFEAAYPGEPIGGETIGKAISAFERTLVAVDSPFDRYLAGDDDALNAQEKDGLAAFLEAGCQDCHTGPMLSDFELRVIGVPNNRALDEVDNGDGSFAFRTGSLRNLSDTGPYMHNGVFRSLEDVVEFYDDQGGRGGLAQGSPVRRQQLDDRLRRLDVDDDEAPAIAAFLRSLNDSDFDREVPESVPSGLPVGGNIY